MEEEKEREKEKEKKSRLLADAQMPTVARAGRGQSKQPGASSASHL